MKRLLPFVTCVLIVGCGPVGENGNAPAPGAARPVKDKDSQPVPGTVPQQREERVPFLREPSPRSGHVVIPRAAALSPDGKLLLLGHATTLKHLPELVSLWDAATGKKICGLPGHQHGVRFVAFLPGGKQAIATGDEGTLTLHDIPSGRLTRTIRPFQKKKSFWVALSPDGRLALTYGSDDSKTSQFRLWQLGTGERIRQFNTGKGPFDRQRMAITSDNKWLVRGGLTGQGTQVQFWDLARGKLIWSTAPKDEWYGPLAVSAERPLVMLIRKSDREYRPVLCEVPSGKVVRELQSHCEPPALFIKGGQQFMGRGENDTVRFWDLASGRELRSVHVPPGPAQGPAQRRRYPATIKAFAISGNASRAVIVTGENAQDVPAETRSILVQVWDLKSGERIGCWRDLAGELPIEP